MVKVTIGEYCKIYFARICVTVTEFPICESTVLNFEFVTCRPAQCFIFRIVMRRYGMMNYYFVRGWGTEI